MTKPAPAAPRGRLHVTHHFHDGERRESLVEREHLAQLDDKPRRRHVSIAWDDSTRLVLVAATPDNPRALHALQVLIKFLQGMPRVVVAVAEGVEDKCEQDVAVVRGGGAQETNGGVEAQSRLEGMDKLSLTESAMQGNGPLSGRGAESGGERRTVFQPENVDLVMCLGGDGLILHVISHLFPTAVPPFMPFNLGSMGFLTPFDFGNHKEDISDVLTGQKHSVTMRMRLKCVIIRQPSSVDATRSPCVLNFEDNMLSDEAVESLGREEYHVLNELVIDRGPAPYLSNLEVLCDDCPVTRVQADGIIVATPTGSTAYSLSSGGSMVHPSVPAILFTPICPHSLSFRPVLFPDYVTLQIKVPEDSRASAWVSFDGRHRMELMRGDKVVVSVSPWSVPTFSRSDTTNDWFTSVSHCLRWNERVIQGTQ